MSNHFTLDTMKSLVFEERYKLKLPKDIGYFHMVDQKISNDIFLFKMDQKIDRDITLDYDLGEIFYINVILEGNYELNSRSNIKTTQGAKGLTITSFMNQDKGIQKKSKKPFKSIGIAIKGDFLKKHLFSKLEDTKNIKNLPVTYFKNETTNIKTQVCANELFYMQNQEDDSLSDIYRESKVLEIIYNEFNDILNMQKKPNHGIKLDEYDKEALNKAKDLLINNLQNPPSIGELSKSICLNEFKLKKGFKEKFNITPYKFLEQCRMEKAKYLLENEDININEVAEFVGYKYPSNFSKVFKQYFNINPKDVMKSRKYYYS